MNKDSPPEFSKEYFSKLFAEHSGVARERKSEAELPVPNTLRPKPSAKDLVGTLRLSQRIGVLLFLHRSGTISEGGANRLMFLQEKAPLEAILAGIKFCERLSTDEKLVKDFWFAVEQLQLKPKSWRYRRSEVRRIGVGYRDKGNLPDLSNSAIRKANEEAAIYFEDLPVGIREFISKNLPSCLSGDGEWLDLFFLIEKISKLGVKDEILPLLSPL